MKMDKNKTKIEKHKKKLDTEDLSAASEPSIHLLHHQKWSEWSRQEAILKKRKVGEKLRYDKLHKS